MTPNCPFPVLLLAFNRPSLTARVLDRIRSAAPPRLYVGADGPRPQRPGEEDACRDARKAATAADWGCEVKTLFRERNLGCRFAVSGALDWFFENEEAGIVLEDDCVPHPSFFRFCSDLLDRYREDTRIMAVSGNNFQGGSPRTPYSYYYSRYNHCWGWAGWRRAWRHYDHDMVTWPEVRASGLLDGVLEKPGLVRYWTRIFDLAHRGGVDSWAYRWTYSCWVQNGLSILPSVNLVTNVGFGDEATHTRGSGGRFVIQAREMPFPLRHPPTMIRDARADWLTHRSNYEPSGTTRFFRRLRGLVR